MSGGNGIDRRGGAKPCSEDYGVRGSRSEKCDWNDNRIFSLAGECAPLCTLFDIVYLILYHKIMLVYEIAIFDAHDSWFKVFIAKHSAMLILFINRPFLITIPKQPECFISKKRG
jgi:hypothetical protein